MSKLALAVAVAVFSLLSVSSSLAAEKSVVVPIHYKTDATASWPISDEQAFVRDKPRVKSVGHRVKISKDTLPEETEIWVMSYR